MRDPWRLLGAYLHDGGTPAFWASEAGTCIGGLPGKVDVADALSERRAAKGSEVFVGGTLKRRLRGLHLGDHHETRSVSYVGGSR